MIALTGARDGSHARRCSQCRSGSRCRCSAGSVLALGAIRRRRPARLSRRARRLRRARRISAASATFTLGQFGGHGGRALRAGDVLRLDTAAASMLDGVPAPSTPRDRSRVRDTRGRSACIDGPHGAPDFFTATTSTRSSRRLGGALQLEPHRRAPDRPEAARGRARDGGEAGLHPSNIHDNAYAIGSVDFTGDMPVILGPDGPSLGGFVCPVTIVRRRTVEDRAAAARRSTCDSGVTIAAAAACGARSRRAIPPIAASSCPASRANARARMLRSRRAGESNLLVEFGPPVLDLELRFQVQALIEELAAQPLAGLLDLTPGIRSLQVHFDPRALSQAQVLDWLLDGRRASCRPSTTCACRAASCICRCPGTTRRRSSRSQRYMQSVRADAPWCPTTSSSSAASTGSSRSTTVRDIVFDASYLVMGLGDVYLGAPVATPLDPRHRLVTTKYNPARTWTPENAVGIGGAYLCVYGMEGPGGYQFVGRTVQMWNRYRQTARFPRRQAMAAAVLRPDPLLSGERGRAAAACARISVRPLSAAHRGIARSSSATTAVPRARNANPSTRSGTQQRSAFEAERERWRAAGLAETPIVEPRARAEAPATTRRIASPSPRRSPAACGRSRSRPGRPSSKGEMLVIMEAMKMEIAVMRRLRGTVIVDHGAPRARPRAPATRCWCCDRSCHDTRSHDCRAGARLPCGRADPEQAVVEATDRGAPRSTRPTTSGSASVDDASAAHARARARMHGRPDSLPLYGIPFAIKDNIDLAGAADHRRLPRLRLSTGRVVAASCRR